MKTETDRLREETEKQYRKERFEELDAYIVTLRDEMEIAFMTSHWHFKLEMIALVLLLILLIAIGDTIITQIVWGFWLGITFLDWFVYQPRVIRSLAKLDSCFETLRILGLISRDDHDGRRKKLRKFRDNPIERLWAKIKRQKQEEVYGTT